jgi:succinoglycan biosynthesis protein ExoM
MQLEIMHAKSQVIAETAPLTYSVLICTFKRPTMLADLLGALSRQNWLPATGRLEVVIVDNDRDRSAEATAATFAADFAHAVVYRCVSEPNIALARNEAVKHASHGHLLFLDDDQMLAPDFFQRLDRAWRARPAGVTGASLHKRERFEADPPEWLARSGLFAWPWFADYAPARVNEVGTGGMILTRALGLSVDGPFDPNYGRTGGEDVAFFDAAQAKGHRFCHISTAYVTERIPPARMRLRYLLQDRFRKGMCDATRLRRQLARSDWWPYVGKSILAFVASLLAVTLAPLFGTSGVARAFCLLSRQCGKLYGAFGGSWQMYARGAKRQRRVLNVTFRIEQGGCERLLEQLSDRLTDLGIDSQYLAYDCDEVRGFGRQLVDRGYRLHTYRKRSGVDWRFAWHLWCVVRRESIDVIHAHDMGGLVYGAMVRCLRPKTRLIHTEHTLHYWIDGARQRWLYAAASLMADQVICVSESVRTEVASRVMVPHHKLKTIENGVDTDKFLPQLAAHPGVDAPLRLVTVGRISPEKNLEEVLRAAALLRESGQPVEVYHCGSGKPEDEADISTLITTLGIGDVVHLHGFMPDPRAVLAGGDVFVSASWTEGHPISVLEAMAAGKLVIVSDIPAHRGLGSDALVVYGRGASCLAATLRNVKEEPERYRHLPALARRRAVTDYSLARTAAAYRDVYVSER